MNKALLTSKSEEYETPQWLFDQLDRIFHFTLDACATKENAKCSCYFSRELDSLEQDWNGTVWMNPPYGKRIERFMEKALRESQRNNATVVCLVPARTDTRWWHEYARKGHIVYLSGRLKFGNEKSSAPFPSAIVIFYGGILSGS